MIGIKRNSGWSLPRIAKASLGAMVFLTVCGLSAQDKAGQRAASTQLTIVNGYARTISLYQVDAGGKEQFYGDLLADEQVLAEAAPGQIWRLKLRNQVVGQFRTGRGPEQLVDLSPSTKTLAVPAAAKAAAAKTDPLDKSLNEPGAVQVTLSIDNQRRAEVEMFWVDHNGKEHSYGKLPAGLTNGLQTWSGHVWRFKLDGQVVGAYRATKDENQSVAVSQKAITPVGAPADDRSINDGNVNVKLFVENQRKEEIELYWVDFDGNEQSYGRYPSGARSEIRTGAGNLWRFRLDGQLISEYRATKDAEQTHNVTAAAKPKPDDEPDQPEAGVSVDDGNVPVNLKFENTRSDVVSVFWVDRKGEEQAFGKVNANSSTEPLKTAAGHLWYFKSDGKIVGTYRATRLQDQTYSIPRSPKPATPQSQDRSEPWTNIPVTLAFQNQRQTAVEVIWYGVDGKESNLGKIEPGTSAGGVYCPGQFFRFKANGQPVFEYRSTGLPQQSVVIPADFQPEPLRPKFAAITFDPTGEWDRPTGGGKPVRMGWQDGQVLFEGTPMSLVADHAYGSGSDNLHIRLIFIDQDTVDFQVGANTPPTVRWVRLKKDVTPPNPNPNPDTNINSNDSWYTLDQPDIDERSEQSDTYNESEFNQVPKIDFILSGYHLFKMHPYDFQRRGVKGSARRIFAQPSKDLKFWSQGGDYKMPDWVQYDSAVRGGSSTDGFTFFSQRDRQESWGTNVGLDLGFKGAKLGLEGSYEETKENTNTRETVGLFVSAQQSAYWLTLLKKRIRFDANFIKTIEQDASFNSHEKCLQFFDTYGTHYPLGVLYGGRAIRSENIVKESFGQSLSKEWSVSGEASGTVKGVDIGLKAGYKQGNMTKNFESSELTEIRTKTLGGEGTSPDNWTLGDKVIPIQLELRPMFELLRPELLPTLPANLVLNRRAQLENAWNTYNNNVRMSDYDGRPRMFEVTAVNWVMEYDDDGGPADVFGKVHCRVMQGNETVRTEGTTVVFDRSDANGSKVIAPTNYVETLNSKQRLVLFPEPRNDGNRLVPDCHLERYRIRVDCNLLDYDKSSANDPVDFAFEFSLSELEQNGRSTYLTLRKSGAGFGSGCGTIRVNVEVREVGELRIDDVKHLSEPPPWRN